LPEAGLGTSADKRTRLLYAMLRQDGLLPYKLYRHATHDIAARLAGLTAQEMVTLVRAHPHRAVIVSLIAGLALGLSSEIRNVLKAAIHR
jgi:hypothetical protein